MRKKSKLFNILLLVIVMLISYGGLFIVLFHPKLINNYENRTAIQLPQFSFSSFLSGEYQTQSEEALADQLPLSATMKKAYNFANATMINQTVNHLFTASQYAPLGRNIFKFGEDYHLVDKPVDVTSTLSDLQKRVSNINEYAKEYPDIQFYTYYIERDVDVDFAKDRPLDVSTAFLNQLALPQEHKGVFAIENFAQYSEYFYKTDHHWNHKGSYKAYIEVLAMLKPKENAIPRGKEVCLDATFVGGRAATIGGGKLYQEPFCAYDMQIPPHTVKTKEGATQYGNEQAYFTKPFDTVSYSAFYGGDIAEIDFNFENKQGNILILGESNDNALLKLIGSHYQNTYSIDLRHYERVYGTDFSFSEFVERKNIDTVLLIGNVNFFLGNEFRLRG